MIWENMSFNVLGLVLIARDDVDEYLNNLLPMNF